MLSREKFQSFSQHLIDKTKSKLVFWQKGQEYTADNRPLGREFDIVFRDCVLSVGYFSPSGDTADYVLMTIWDTKGGVVAQRRIEMGTADWDLAVQLCLAANESVQGMDIFREIEQEITGNGPVGKPPVAPNLFALISGRWRVTYTIPGTNRPGAEDAIIDGDGVYYLAKAPDTPYFKLSAVRYDPDTRKLRFTKISMREGRAAEPWDTESLVLSEDGNTMTGMSEGFGHSMTYKRN